MRRASLHFAEDFVLSLKDENKGIYSTGPQQVQTFCMKNFGCRFNEDQMLGLVTFFRRGRLHKDNQYIFSLASFVCDLMDDRLDIKKGN